MEAERWRFTRSPGHPPGYAADPKGRAYPTPHSTLARPRSHWGTPLRRAAGHGDSAPSHVSLLVVAGRVRWWRSRCTTSRRTRA
jgi:hypothetical protein